MGNYDRFADRLVEIANRNDGEVNLNIKPQKEKPIKRDTSTVTKGRIPGSEKVKTGQGEHQIEE